MGVFEKSQEKIIKKHQILSIQFYKIPYTYKPSIGKKIIKNPYFTYLNFNAFFSLNFEKSQENLNKKSGKSGKISQLDLWQP